MRNREFAVVLKVHKECVMDSFSNLTQSLQGINLAGTTAVLKDVLVAASSKVVGAVVGLCSAD